jgi:hypothetical protein
MPPKSTPVHLRKSGPGTGGRNVERDMKICARRAGGALLETIGKEFNLSRERVRQVIWAAERDAATGRTRWMSARERREAIANERAT